MKNEEYSVFIQVVDANNKLIKANELLMSYNKSLTNDIEDLKDFASFLKPFIWIISKIKKIIII